MRSVSIANVAFDGVYANMRTYDFPRSSCRFALSVMQQTDANCLQKCVACLIFIALVLFEVVICALFVICIYCSSMLTEKSCYSKLAMWSQYVGVIELFFEFAWIIPGVHLWPPRLNPSTRRVIDPGRRSLECKMSLVGLMLFFACLMSGGVLIYDARRSCDYDVLMLGDVTFYTLMLNFILRVLFEMLCY
jgi:hypothetical protein